MLRPYRQVKALNIDFITLNTSERGGVLSVGSASGLVIAEYAIQPSGAVALGIQFNDVEFLDRSREFDPRRNREVEVPCGIVGIATDGEFETDWVHIVGALEMGDPAYVGPSGLLTNSASFGGQRVGKFISPLKAEPHVVIFKGAGFHREKIDPITKLPTFENDPRARKFVLSDGFIRIRISSKDIIDGRVEKL